MATQRLPKTCGYVKLGFSTPKMPGFLAAKKSNSRRKGYLESPSPLQMGSFPKMQGHAPMCKESWRLHIPSKTHIHVGQNILASSFPAVRVNCTPHPVSCSSSCGVRHARPTSRCRVATDGLTRNKCVRQRKTTHW